jgi:hypothetical protein
MGPTALLPLRRKTCCGVYTNQDSHHRRPKRKYSPGIEAIPADTSQRVFAISESPVQLCIDAEDDHTKHLLRRNVVSQELRHVSAAFDYHGCINSDFIAESRAPLPRRSPCRLTLKRSNDSAFHSIFLFFWSSSIV